MQGNPAKSGRVGKSGATITNTIFKSTPDYSLVYIDSTWPVTWGVHGWSLCGCRDIVLAIVIVVVLVLIYTCRLWKKRGGKQLYISQHCDSVYEFGNLPRHSCMISALSMHACHWCLCVQPMYTYVYKLFSEEHSIAHAVNYTGTGPHSDFRNTAERLGIWGTVNKQVSQNNYAEWAGWKYIYVIIMPRI